MKDTLPITLRGKKKLEDELKKLVSIERPEVIRLIEAARANGDLSENADYDAAKERQAWIESRVQEIQNHLAGAEVVDTSKIKSDRVVFGAHVKIMDQEDDKQYTYQIVGVDEADVNQGKISIVSPLARALIGKVAGDVVEVKTPASEKEYEILSFRFE
ncbi:MAG: transcription elongation factor GreA [Bdellovibrionales bacterium CG10_big_fil_rev_8_21_14_0_10_45_34]|nr:MAG: transcription elongation factor GreA [Bdellovibrionales bacterium CG10_big_fil_rev_8_21_14_0_10_45_34]